MHFLNDSYKIKIFFLSLLFSCLSGKSASITDPLQKSSAVFRSFEPGKILNNSPNYSLIFDESGILFLGQQDKISIFNGFSWLQVHVKGEILLTCNSDNKIFFCGENALGYLYPDSSLKLRVHYLNSSLPAKLQPFEKAEDVESIDKTVYFQTDSLLFSYNGNEFTILDDVFITGKIFKCNQKLVTLKSGNRINVFQGNNLEKSFKFTGPEIQLVLPHKEGFLIFTRQNKCFYTNNSFNIINEFNDTGIADPVHGTLVNPDEYILADANNVLYLFGENAIIKSLLNSPYAMPGSGILDIVHEPSGNIWVLQEKSITRIEYLSSVGIVSSLSGNLGSVLDLKLYDNKIFIATTQGLFYNRPGGDQFELIPLSNICFGLIRTLQGLLAISDNKIFLVNKELPLPVYSGQILDQSWNALSNKLYVSRHDKVFILKLEGNQIMDTSSIIPPVTPIKILSIDSSLWITDGECLFFYNTLDALNHKAIKIFTPELTEINEIFNWQNKLHLLADHKVYSLSDGKLSFEKSLSNDLFRDEFINLIEDEENNIWIHTRNQDKNSILWFGNSSEKTFKKIILPVFQCTSISSIDYIGDQKLILSSGMQIFLIDIRNQMNQPGNFETIITQITTGDQILFNGISYNFFKIPLRSSLNQIHYSQNDLRIDLSSTNYLGNKVQYQHFLEGVDKIWSEWNNNPYIYFKNLKEGKYELRIRCRNYLDETSGVTTLLFRIAQPFYRTWWAYFVYFIACGVLLFIAYKTYLLNLHKTQEIIPLKSDDYSHAGHITEDNSDSESSANDKKYDRFFNIDEETEKEKTRWDKYEMVTVLFSDIQGFTKIAESMNPELLIDELDRFFFHFDSVVEKYNIEKIKTIGDAYMAAGGIPKKTITNPIEVVLAALEMQTYMKQMKRNKIDIWDLRIGIHSGPVIAGIIGHKKRSFDIWGDTVNTASRMESTGEAGKVNISGETYKLVKDYFICEYRGKLPAKYKGNIDMYFVKGLRPELSINLVGLPNRKFFLKLQILRLSDLEELVLSNLRANLSNTLLFHNVEYASHLFEYSELLAKAADLDLEETLLIRTSALLLNVGFSEVYENMENRSAVYARNILPEFNYSEKQINTISNLILSTKWPPEPKNMLEKVFYDIKMEYIGRADFIKLYKLLFFEQNQYFTPVNVSEFKLKQLEIIQQYLFFTESARRLREVPAEEQIIKIKNDDWL